MLKGIDVSTLQSNVVPSSTKDSSKYFAITVDDTGTIKATEVTNN